MLKNGFNTFVTHLKCQTENLFLFSRLLKVEINNQLYFMETVYLGLILFLFVLAIFDLVVGVSNDAVNFLNSAIGSKVARFRTVLIVAAAGVLIGAVVSNGMMDIARHGIFQPQMFSFNDLLCIFLAVMVTDVVLLDIFNSLGMPTSTTVSMVFELLGGTFILALLKIAFDETGTLGFAELMNTEKALSVILGIFLSVAIAFVVGVIVQWISRLIFTFNYRKNLNYTIGIFGGIAVTAILYFTLVKGLKGSAFAGAPWLEYINQNISTALIASLVIFTILMQILHFLKVNVFKIIILMGTFALAMAFAGNDLVNFIGVPLAAYSAFQDFVANGAGNADTFMMSSLNESAKTPFVFLLIAGIIMVFALAFSKKAHNVIKTSVDLSRQDEGEEMFGSSRVARSIVRGSTSIGEFLSNYTPKGLSSWCDKRFNKNEVILENGAAFDLVRASVNLVVAGLLIIMGTSLKLPLSTTYVTFIVAMGSSLADRAWSRESAVFRITGVLNVIGGWFLTAAVAFISCAFVTILMYYGGMIVMFAFVILSIYILLKNNIGAGKKDERGARDVVFQEMMATRDKVECWGYLKKHVSITQKEVLDFVAISYERVIDGFTGENLKTLRKVSRKLDQEKRIIKNLRQRELVGMRRIDTQLSLEKNTWFHLSTNSDQQMIYCLKRMNDPCQEHVDNNFNPLNEECVTELQQVKQQVLEFITRGGAIIEEQNLEIVEAFLLETENYKDKLSVIRKKQFDRLQTENSQYLKVALVYLNILQESQELISCLRHDLRAYKKFIQ